MNAPKRSYTLKELAALYGISRDTMRQWLKRVKDLGAPPSGRIYNIEQVQKIFDHHGTPDNFLPNHKP
jgi:hypothetical protein